MNCEIIIYEHSRRTPRTISLITSHDIYHMVIRDAFNSGVFDRLEIRTSHKTPSCLSLWIKNILFKENKNK